MKAMLALFAVLLSLGLVSSSTIARADADDAAWIKKCVSDNKREGATAPVVAAYCACMNDKMSSSETLSITAWEKSHPVEMAACDKESGWKGFSRWDYDGATGADRASLERTDPSPLCSCGLRGAGNRPCRSPVAFPRAARD